MRKFLNYLFKLFLICIIIYSFTNIYMKIIDYKNANETYTNMQQIKKSSTTDYEEQLLSINPDFKFWIKVDGTNIDYPVVQSIDNEYYLHKDFENKKSSSGAIFLDYNNDFDNDKNIIIYGHNMKNKTMFSQLEKYKKPDFFDDNNKIRIFKNGKEYIYEVFSSYYTSTSFDYIINKFKNDSDFEEYIEKVKNKSLFESNIGVSSKDKIITLSTCSYEGGDNRMVVHGRLIK